MDTFNRAELIGHLQKLSAKHRVVYAALCCNRVISSYAAFSRQANWGDNDALLSAVNYIWDCLEGAAPSKRQVGALISECENAIPDLDEIDVELATWGHDAALVIVHALRCLQNGSIEDSASAGVWCHATVDAFVQDKMDLDPANPKLEEQIAAHPLMQRELKQQRADLDFLLRHSNLTTADVMRLRHAWQNHGKSNVDLS